MPLTKLGWFWLAKISNEYTWLRYMISNKRGMKILQITFLIDWSLLSFLFCYWVKNFQIDFSIATGNEIHILHCKMERFLLLDRPDLTYHATIEWVSNAKLSIFLRQIKGLIYFHGSFSLANPFFKKSYFLIRRAATAAWNVLLPFYFSKYPHRFSCLSTYSLL